MRGLIEAHTSDHKHSDSRHNEDKETYKDLKLESERRKIYIKNN